MACPCKAGVLIRLHSTWRWSELVLVSSAELCCIEVQVRKLDLHSCLQSKAQQQHMLHLDFTFDLAYVGGLTVISKPH